MWKREGGLVPLRYSRTAVSDCQWLGGGVLPVFFPIPATAENLHPLHLQFPGFFYLGTRGHCMNSGSFLHLVCGWERLLSLRTSLRSVPCQKPPTYFTSLLSWMSTPSVIMIPFHVHLLRYATLLLAFGNPPGTRLLLLITWMLWVLCSQVDVEKIFWLNSRFSPHELLMLSKNDIKQLWSGVSLISGIKLLALQLHAVVSISSPDHIDFFWKKFWY